MVFLALNVAGCAAFSTYRAPVRPPLGLLFISVKAPLSVNFAGNPTGPGVKRYTQTETHYFRDFLLTTLDFGWDEAAIARAAREAGINEVSYADYEIVNVLGIYGRFTVNIYGN